MHVSRWLSFVEHRKIIKLYAKKLREQAIEGHQQVTLSQVMQADKQLFKQLSDCVDDGLVPPNNVEFRLDAILDQQLSSVEIAQLLMQRQGQQRATGTASSGDRDLSRQPAAEQNEAALRKRIKDEVKAEVFQELKRAR